MTTKDWLYTRMYRNMSTTTFKQGFHKNMGYICCEGVGLENFCNVKVNGNLFSEGGHQFGKVKIRPYKTIYKTTTMEK